MAPNNNEVRAPFSRNFLNGVGRVTNADLMGGSFRDMHGVPKPRQSGLVIAICNLE